MAQNENGEKGWAGIEVTVFLPCARHFALCSWLTVVFDINSFYDKDHTFGYVGG